jgi:DHA2 family multidrug resistance protein
MAKTRRDSSGFRECVSVAGASGGANEAALRWLRTRPPWQLARQDVTEHGLRRTLVVVSVMAAALMQTLDITITNVALPTIQGNLGASADEGTWVVTAYTIAAIIVIPITPWLQDRFGRKRYFAVSIVGFTLASIGCGISDTLQALIFMR